MELILAISTGKDAWQEINISLIRRSKKPEVRVVRTREFQVREIDHIRWITEGCGSLI
jgi:hypothetical protein